MADALSALIYLVKGERELAIAVWQAYKEFILRHKELGTKRKAVRSGVKQESRTIYRGSIVVRYALGQKIFGQLFR